MLEYQSKQDFDGKCEELIDEEFDAICNVDVDDVVEKLEALGVFSRNGDRECSTSASDNLFLSVEAELSEQKKVMVVKRV